MNKDMEKLKAENARLKTENVEQANKLHAANLRNGKLRKELDTILADVSSVMKSREEAKDGS